MTFEETAYNTSRRILSWAEEDRPREKLLLKGKGALSDAELIAILIGSGTRELSAVDLSKIILQKASNNLNELAKLSLKDLMKIKGIGEAKAISIAAALELGRRRKDSDVVRRPKITSSKDAYEQIRSYLMDLPHEEFWVLLLTRSNEVIRPVQISQGGISGTIADPKIIFKSALEHLASSMILVHNHPSGNLKPSEADKELTRRLVTSGKLLDIPILDHLIISELGYLSFADEGLL
ncbi:DNA repair protein RadC [Runella defluvii]|uniref:DNA repair protein RadC n=1 Tax=Runella defluvii TaxID=370973 RepID=A0A7W5ZMD2_9BACT|nr:DNA repair protein RadC [Runella defluvii]MBB3838377.1 DNA repair protein RadC [Runella defluvii]